MALVACPECGAQVSDSAPACPRCGHRNPAAAAAASPPRVSPLPPVPPRRSSSMPGWAIALLVVGGFFGVVVLLGIVAALAIPRLAADREAAAPEELVTYVDVDSLAGDTAVHTSADGPFGVRVNAGSWQPHTGEDLNEAADLEFQHRSGEAFAIVIAERVGMPLASLRDIAVENLEAGAAELRIVEEGKRTVGGREVLSLVADGTVDGIPIRYHGYYYSGDDGTVQVLTFTSRNLFEEHRADMAELLEGLRFGEGESAAPATETP